MLVGTDVCVTMVFVWEETGVPGGNPPVLHDDQHGHLTCQRRVSKYRLYSFHIYVYEVDCHIFTSIEIILSLIIEGWMWKYLLLYSIALRTLSLSLMDRYWSFNSIMVFTAISKKFFLCIFKIKMLKNRGPCLEIKSRMTSSKRVVKLPICVSADTHVLCLKGCDPNFEVKCSNFKSWYICNNYLALNNMY